MSEQEAVPSAERRRAAYLKKVLPPIAGGSFDVYSGESYLEPPTIDIDDPDKYRRYAEAAVRQVFDSDELDQKLKILAAELYEAPDEAGLAGSKTKGDG